jgi:shikimate dehydrogenase
MKIDSRTRFLCVLGDPVEHSLSPLMHNAVFEGGGHNLAYGAFRVPSEALEEAVRGLKALGFLGFNVTLPHKEAVLPLLDAVSPEAERVGAVNTVEVRERRLVGHNTDGIGAIRALREKRDPKGAVALVLGAGGAARAISFALASEGVSSLVIANRTREKAERLAEEVREVTGVPTTASSLEEESLRERVSEATLLINATSVGMHPREEETPLTGGITPDHTVMDIVYNPVETRFLREAREAGAETIDGVGMFVHQGAESLRIWLGIDPPLPLMEEVVRKALGGRR